MVFKVIPVRVVTIFSLVLCVVSVKCEPHELFQNAESVRDPSGKGPGDALFLTPYIEQGRLKEGRQRASVDPFVGNIKSYAGYLTVDKTYNSNMFFWYFESENDPINDPTVVWLQGGPGCSGLFGLFIENGPYIIDDKQKILKRKHSWSKVSNIIYFDNPVGTGYSFTDDDSGYATNETKVADDLYAALIQLFKLFPRIQKNELYITGESYAGKYIPALGNTIHLKNNQHPGIYLNLKGLMIGNGFTDPIHMMMYSNYLYQIGLIDDNAKMKLHKKELQIVKATKLHEWHEANILFERLLDDRTSLYFKYTGLNGYYNYFNPNSGEWYDYDEKFVTGNAFRRHIHVGNQNYSDGSIVFSKLFDDMPKSVINLVAELLDHYRILFYNGQLDIICAYPLTVSYLRNMKWSLSREYKVAKRHRFIIDGDVAGYYKNVGNLTELLVRNAGHLVPADQPLWSLKLLDDFIHNSIVPKTTKKDVRRRIIKKFPGFK